jgi:hypothetical protein
MSASSGDELDLLAAELSRLSTAEQKLDVLIRPEPLLPGSTPVGELRPDGATSVVKARVPDDYTERFERILGQHGFTMAQVREHHAKRAKSGIYQTQFLTVLPYNPCANGDPRSFRACPDEGKSTCSGCKVVSYCSQVRGHALRWNVHSCTVQQECQRTHWTQHKRGK